MKLVKHLVKRLVPRAAPACAVFAGALGCADAVDVDVASSAAAQAIINGESCDEQVESSAVAVLLDATVSFDGQGTFDLTQVLCTGTLIAPDVVLLAAHCVDTTSLTFGFGTVDRADFYISFESDLSALAEADPGAGPLPIPASALPVRDFVAHPAFDLNSLGQGTSGPVESDIALLFLDVAVDGVRPEVVITRDEAAQLRNGTPVTLAGWGQQVQTPQFQAPPPGSVGIKQCGASTIDELGDTLMQIGAAASATRKCHGDSGGPTYVEVETESSIKRRVIGVTSRAYDERDCALGGVDTRVDAFLDFIDDEMTAHCDDGTRVFCDVKGIVPASFYEGGGGGNDEDDGGRRGGIDSVDPKAADGGCPGGCGAGPVDASVFAGLGALFFWRRRR